MKAQVIQSFKPTSSLDLKLHCGGLEISHKFSIGVLILSNQVHLINTDDLLQGNVSKLVNTGINAQRIICSEDRLAVGFNGIVTIYNLSDLKQPVATVNAKTGIRRMSFNPTDCSMIAVLTEDGNLTLAKLSAQGVETFALNETKITAICFSPKGKQLCVGHSDGTMSQLKLDLSFARRIPGNIGTPLSILWVSTTQFLVSFLVNQDLLELVQIDLQKAPAPPVYSALGDPFVSDAANLQSQTFMTTLHPNAIICSATTSTDVVVLAKVGDKWEVELSEDDRKANLPLDHHSVGQVLYFNSVVPVIVDAVTYNPMPVYVFASHLGTVRSFSVINSQEKGEGQKFASGITPLNLSSFGPPHAVLAVAVPPQPPAVPVATSAPFSFSPTVPVPSEKPAQPFNLQSQQPPAPFSFSFNPNPAGGIAPILTRPTPIIQSASTTQESTIPPSQPIMTTPAKPKEEVVKHIGEAKKNLEAEMDKAEVAAVRRDEPSPGIIHHFQEFKKRFGKFQGAKAACTAKLTKDMTTLKDALESSMKDLHRSEDFIHDMKKTCAAQQREIHALKEKTISDLAQMEYVQGIAERNKDPAYLQLLRARQLDPKTLKEFKALEKSYSFLRSQIQECRKYYYFAKAPEVPPSSPIGMAFIRETLSNHSKVLQRLINENNSIREKLGLHGSLDKLTEQMKGTFISDDSSPTVPVKKIETLKDFLKQRKVIRLKPDVYDYIYDGGSVQSMNLKTEVRPPPARAPPAPEEPPQIIKQAPSTFPTGISFTGTGSSGTKTTATVPFGIPTSTPGFLTTAAPVSAISTTRSGFSTPGAGISTTAPTLLIKSTVPSFGLATAATSTATSSSPFGSTTAQSPSMFPSFGPIAGTTGIGASTSVVSSSTLAPTSFGMTSTFPTFGISTVTTSATAPSFATITPAPPASTGNKTVSFGSPVVPATTTGNKTVSFGTPITTIASGNKPNLTFGMPAATATTSSALGGVSTLSFSSGMGKLTPAFGLTTTTAPASTIPSSFPTFGITPTVPSFGILSTAPSAFEIPKSSPTGVTTTSPAILTTTMPAVSQSAGITPFSFKPKDESLTITPVSTTGIIKTEPPPSLGTITVTPVLDIPKICSPFGSGGTTSASPAFGIGGTTASSAFGIPSTVSTTSSASTGVSTSATTLPAFGIGAVTTTASSVATPAFGITTTVPAGSMTPSVTPPSFGIGALGPFGVSTSAPENKTAPFGTTIPAFGNLTPTSAFGAPAKATTPFGSGVTTTASSLFGSGNTTTSTTSLFGGGAVTTSTATPAFGSGISTTSSASSLFGGGGVTTSAPAPLFGGSGSTTTATPVFGSGITASSPTSPFGSNTFGSTGFLSGLGTTATPTTGEVKNVFGGGSTFGQNVSPNIFGGVGTPTVNAGPVTTQSASNFSFALPSSQQPSAFGSASGTSGSIFGGASTFGTTAAPAPSFGGSGVFGSSPLSAFGTPSSVASGTGSIFGGGAPSAVGFGQLAQQSPSTGGFGGGSNIFGGSSTFGAPVGSSPSSSTTGSIFGGGGSQFGGQAGSSAFGSTTGGSVFGGTSTFGSSPASGPSMFGGGTQLPQQQQGSPFGGGGGSAVGDAGIFGGSSSSFGSPPSFGQAVAPQQTGNIFGGAGSPFGGGTGSAFGSGFSSFSSQSPQQQQQQPTQSSPSFGGSSFSSWR